MGRDWVPHYADIYMAQYEKEALLKCPLNPHTCFPVFGLYFHNMVT